MSINSVCISGNLGHDPELRMTQSGMAICKFSVCVNDRKRDPQTGNWHDDPNWVDVTFFGKRAESIEQYLSKGSLVFVSGKLHENKWQTQDGQNRRKLEVIGEDIQFGNSGGNKQQAQQQQEQQYQPPQGYQYADGNQYYNQQPQPDYANQQQMDMGDGFGVYDDDIPF